MLIYCGTSNDALKNKISLRTTVSAVEISLIAWYPQNDAEKPGAWKLFSKHHGTTSLETLFGICLLLTIVQQTHWCYQTD